MVQASPLSERLRTGAATPPSTTSPGFKGIAQPQDVEDPVHRPHARAEPTLAVDLGTDRIDLCLPRAVRPVRLAPKSPDDLEGIDVSARNRPQVEARPGYRSSQALGSKKNKMLSGYDSPSVT